LFFYFVATKAKLIPQAAEARKALAAPSPAMLLRTVKLGTADDVCMTSLFFGAALQSCTKIEQQLYAYECNHELSNNGNWVCLASES